MPAPSPREGGRWGLSSSGHFHLADDEALLLTLDPMGAKYDGSIFVRWQKLPEPMTAQGPGLRDARLVKLTAPGALLPAVSQADRKKELAARAASYDRRFAE